MEGSVNADNTDERQSHEPHFQGKGLERDCSVSQGNLQSENCHSREHQVGATKSLFKEIPCAVPDAMENAFTGQELNYKVKIEEIKCSANVGGILTGKLGAEEHESFGTKSAFKSIPLSISNTTPNTFPEQGFAYGAQTKANEASVLAERCHVQENQRKGTSVDFTVRNMLSNNVLPPKAITCVHGTVKPPFICNICNRVEVASPLISSESPSSYCAPSQSCGSKNILKGCVKVTAMRKPYVCGLCGKSFYQNSSLVNHLKLHAKERQHICNICDKLFVNNRNLKEHERTHTGEKPYPCDICHKTFSQMGTLKNHLKTHSSDRPYVCATCGRGFNVKRNLREHLRTHTGERPFICFICGKAFCQSGTLTSHMRSHTGEKPHTCEVCGKKFSASRNLREHQLIHTGEKPFTCYTCGKSFRHTGTFTSHIKLHNAGTL